MRDFNGPTLLFIVPVGRILTTSLGGLESGSKSLGVVVITPLKKDEGLYGLYLFTRILMFSYPPINLFYTVAKYRKW